MLVRHVSFVDCPGHDTLMATMLAGAAVMDVALLLVAGNQPYPQPQTREHLIGVDIMQLEHILVIQNKQVQLTSLFVTELLTLACLKFFLGTVYLERMKKC